MDRPFNEKWELNDHRWGEFLADVPHRTITELCRIPLSLEDGLYWLNLQLPAIATDAVPSRPILSKPIRSTNPTLWFPTKSILWFQQLWSVPIQSTLQFLSKLQFLPTIRFQSIRIFPTVRIEPIRIVPTIRVLSIW